MAFVFEKISKEDREYFNTLGFTFMSGRPSEARWWSIDREKNMVFVARGGVYGELFKGYQLWTRGAIINMEAIENVSKSELNGELIIHWSIYDVEVPNELTNISEDEIEKAIREAIVVEVYSGIDSSRIGEVIVEIKMN